MYIMLHVPCAIHPPVEVEAFKVYSPDSPVTGETRGQAPSLARMVKHWRVFRRFQKISGTSACFLLHFHFILYLH